MSDKQSFGGRTMREYLFNGRQAAVSALLVCAALLTGCTSEATFSLNAAYLRKQEKPFDSEEKGVFKYNAVHQTDIGDILVGLFGTPDEPNFPSLTEIDVTQVVDAKRLSAAAGRVGEKDELENPRGLYREHCAHCHGINGDGAGPTAAYLNPYPRDYRMGVFKFKSTPKGFRPTHADLKRILINGIPNTAMPSFRVLSDPEIESLVHYVKYLAIRGEVERALIYKLGDLDEEAGERLLNIAGKDQADSAYATQINDIRKIVSNVVSQWSDASANATEVVPPSWKGDELKRQEQIVRGRALFYQKLECIKCHGETAIGDGEQNIYDQWTEELFGKTPQPDDIREFTAYGAHPPRNIRPRNLRLGVYRGGRRPIDLFWRVRNGIDGTGMPGQEPKVSNDDIWAVIEYVRSLPYESISRPDGTTENLKEVR